MVIASALGMALSAVFLKLLVVESGASRRLLTSVRERRWRERTRDLIHHDRSQALSESIDPSALLQPSPLRAAPLYGCGPSFSLDGSPQPG